MIMTSLHILLILIVVIPLLTVGLVLYILFLEAFLKFIFNT